MIIPLIRLTPVSKLFIYDIVHHYAFTLIVRYCRFCGLMAEFVHCLKMDYVKACKFALVTS